MVRPAPYVLFVIGMAVLCASAAHAKLEPGPVDLLDAMASGQVDAVFYGNGDQMVHGRIRRSSFGPDALYIAPGTQFWAQRPGLQGMTTLGWVPIDLSTRAYAYIDVPAACTNYDLPAPTTHDRMVPVCCPEPRMAALSERIGRVMPPRVVAQLAVWAVADNPTWDEVAGLVHGRVQAQTPEDQARLIAAYRLQAAQLLWQVGIRPTEYRMFDGLDLSSLGFQN